MKRVSVPLTLDAPARFLFWDADYVMVAACGFGCGTIIAAWWAGIAVGGVARAFALFYWHLPFDLFKRVPASARRHFFG